MTGILTKVKPYLGRLKVQKGYQKLLVILLCMLSFHILFLKKDTHYHSDIWKDDDPIVQLFNLFSDTKPNIPPLTDYIGGHKAEEKFASDRVFFTKEYLSNLLSVNSAQVTELTKKHSEFIKKMRLLPFNQFASPKKLLGGDGIVIVGGDRFSWLALLNIHQLRATGCKLPVEVFLPTYNDYETQLCETILPNVNARCVVGAKEYPSFKFYDKLTFKGFQLKVMALFASSFERILLLDADNVVTIDPTKLFSWHTFQETGLVVWPDSWARTTQPSFYDIAGIKVGNKPVRGYSLESDDPKEWNFHDLDGTLPNPTCESGMLLLDKKKQVESMLLAFYYNLNGPDFYYPLLTQGSAGQGDKDTFIAAAYALNKPVYQVKQGMSFLGYADESGFHSKALGQWDPLTPRENNTDNGVGECMFLHLSYPKLYPDQLKGEITRESSDGSHRKMYESHEANEHYDFDLRMWELMTQLLCNGYDINPQQNPASYAIPPSQRLSALKLDFIKGLSGDKYCKSLHLPHLKYLRTQTK